MMRVALGFAVLSALLCIAFFVLESVAFTTTTGMEVFQTTAAQAENTKVWAFNQGFYNLFLGVGILAGVGFVAAGRQSTGRPLLYFGCCAMVGAGVVLFAGGGVAFLGGALAQGVPPLIAIAALSRAR